MHIQDLLSLPITNPKLIKNLMEEILLSRFPVVSFHESITTNLTTRQVGDRRPTIAEYLKQVDNKILKGTNQNDPNNHEQKPVHNVMFWKD